MSGQLSDTPLARGLLRVGEDGITPGDDAIATHGRRHSSATSASAVR